ncbi:RNA-binding protein 12 [Sesbania bispinosa]|nr:RNA-binding protein 12 [Sesbania bispinosa]
MASHNCFILAFFIAISLSSMDIGLAARHLMQTAPTLPQPQGNFPPLPTIPIPSLPTIPQVTLPPLPAISSLPNIPTNMPSIPFLSPPPSTTTP